MNEKSGGAAAAPGAAVGGAGQGYTMEEVAKHTTESDCWVVVAGQVLNVTNFLKDHPGGALAILTFAGKDATEEFNMIHPPDVIGKYAPDARIGVIGEGGPAPVADSGAAAPLLAAEASKAPKKDMWDWDTASRKQRLKGYGKIDG